MIPSLPIGAVERLLGARHGPARILDSTILKSWERNDVWRVRVKGGPDLPAMAIVKRWKAEPPRGLDEWAALAVLTEAGLAAAPRFLGGDAAARCFVMEDLGAPPVGGG